MKKTFLLVVLSLCSLFSGAQTYASYKDYVEKFKDIAIREMKEEGIPASITLAQGLLESGAGKSMLAVKANNHFGIKCTLDWKGGSVRKDDDHKNECFRKYAHVDESYRDHSLFLKRERYARLYDLAPTDYKGWAYGLKACGYATDPNYPAKIIKIVEDYQLHQYDLLADAKPSKKEPVNALEPAAVASASAGPFQILTHPNRGLQYVKAIEGEGVEDIANRYGVSAEKLLKDNELRYDSKLEPGQNVFFKKKGTSGADKYYTVKQGDTMYLISQELGMQVKYLYQRNGIKIGAEPEAGTELYLRSKNPSVKKWYQ